MVNGMLDAKFVAQRDPSTLINWSAEDRDMQRQIGEDPRSMDYLVVTLGADRAGVFVRKFLKNKLAAEGRSLQQRFVLRSLHNSGR